jgi:hypothetical protein
MAVWFSLQSLGIFFPFWYVWTEQNLATLARKIGSTCLPEKLQIDLLLLTNG